MTFTEHSEIPEKDQNVLRHEVFAVALRWKIQFTRENAGDTFPSRQLWKCVCLANWEMDRMAFGRDAQIEGSRWRKPVMVQLSCRSLTESPPIDPEVAAQALLHVGECRRNLV